jgi:hypothetical protein
MNMLRNILFFVLCFAIGAGGVLLVRHFKNSLPPPPPVVTRVGTPPTLRGFELPAAAADALRGFPALNATAVALEYGDGSHLASAAKAAHEAHLQVLLVPAAADTGPAFFPRDPYPKPLPEVAAEAQAAGVDILCISWLKEDPDETWWREQIAAVRKAFAGKLILATNSDTAPAVGLWDAVDYLGITGPVELPRRLPGADQTYTIRDARVLWAAKLDEWESLGARNARPVILLNMQLPLDAGATLPAAGAPAPAPPPGLRDTFYEALLLETKGRQSTEGLFIRWEKEDGLRAILPRITALWSPQSANPAPPPGSPPGP